MQQEGSRTSFLIQYLYQNAGVEMSTKIRSLTQHRCNLIALVCRPAKTSASKHGHTPTCAQLQGLSAVSNMPFSAYHVFSSPVSQFQ